MRITPELRQRYGIEDEPSFRPDLDAKREAELLRMRQEKQTAEDAAAITEVTRIAQQYGLDTVVTTKAPEMQNALRDNGWQPALDITQKMGLKGSTTQEIADEIAAAVEKTAPVVEPDINNLLAELLAEEETEELDPHVVPLDQQKTEEEEASERVSGRRDRRSRAGMDAEAKEELNASLSEAGGHILRDRRVDRTSNDLDVVTPVRPPDPVTLHDPQRPWTKWLEPTLVKGKLHSFRVLPGIRATALQVENRLTGDFVGDITLTFLTALGRRCKFPPEFVGEIPNHISVDVINYRIEETKNQDVSILVIEGKCVGFIPAGRGLLSYRQAAETAYETLRRYYPEVRVAHVSSNGEMVLRLLTPVCYAVTEGEGDALTMGIEVHHDYNGTLEVSLLTQRVKDGGVILSHTQAFSWRERLNDAQSTENQIKWLEHNILVCISHYPQFIERLKAYSATTGIKDSSKAVSVIGESIGILKKNIEEVYRYYELHTGDTQWHIIKAFSRWATFGAEEDRRENQLKIGGWIESNG